MLLISDSLFISLKNRFKIEFKPCFLMSLVFATAISCTIRDDDLKHGCMFARSNVVEGS